jgi:hypothetical protein
MHTFLSTFCPCLLELMKTITDEQYFYDGYDSWTSPIWLKTKNFNIYDQDRRSKPLTHGGLFINSPQLLDEFGFLLSSLPTSHKEATCSLSVISSQIITFSVCFNKTQSHEHARAGTLPLSHIPCPTMTLSVSTLLWEPQRLRNL